MNNVEQVVIKLLNDDAKIDDLLSRLDELAREVNAYNYGLPLYDEANKDRLRKAVLKWVAGF